MANILDRDNLHKFLHKQQNKDNSFIANVNVLVSRLDVLLELQEFLPPETIRSLLELKAHLSKLLFLTDNLDLLEELYGTLPEMREIHAAVMSLGDLNEFIEFVENVVENTIQDIQDRFAEFVVASGYQFIGNYGPGIEITEYNQLVRDLDGEFWRLSGERTLPYVTTGVGIVEENAFIPVGDASLRQHLKNPTLGSALVQYDENNTVKDAIDRNRENFWANKETLGGVYTHYVREDDGDPISGAECAVYVGGTGVLATNLRDKHGAPLANPFTTGEDGLVQFIADPGKYTLQVSFNLIVHTYSVYFADDGLRNDLANPDKGAVMVGFKQDGIGAVARTLEDKAREWVSVKDFGAVGDGVTDDTEAIQKAIATRKSVFFPEPEAFYNITDEIGPKWPGQKLFANSKVRGMIRNVTNDRRLAIIGDPLRADGAAPQAGLINLCFYGNPLSTGGIVLATNLNAGNPDWSDASKDCVIDHCAVDYVGNGWALEVYSWCNTISDFTCYEGNLKGCLYADGANQNASLGLYLTGCTEQSLQIGGDGSQRRSRGNLFAGLVVQQSGGSVGCVTIADADNTVITSLYSERNNESSSCCVVHIDATATGTCINGASHLSGGAIFIRNEGKNTTVTSVVSSNITGAIVENKGNGSIVSHSIDWLPDVVPTGVKFSDQSTAKNGVYFDSVGFRDLKLRSYAPLIEFEDMSASQKKLRIKVDQGVLRAEYDSAGDGEYSQLLFVINPAVPDMSIDGMVRPNTDGSRNLGTGSRRWANVYASTGAINTSDEREKTSIVDPDDALMRAWGKVNFRVFRFNDAVKKKGNAARIHAGVIAQQVVQAFNGEGLDATKHGLLCYDEWPDEYETVEVEDTPAVLDADGNEVTPAQTHKEQRCVVEAGSRYGIRYSEALCLEAAYQRRRAERIEQRLNAIEALMTMRGLE